MKNQTTQTSQKDMKDSDLKPSVCDKCGDPKEVLINWFGVMTLKPIICSCRKKVIAEDKKRLDFQDQQRRLQEIRKFSLMDSDFQQKNFNNFVKDQYNSTLYNIGKNYCDKFEEMRSSNSGLLLYGDPGIGKTYLTACISNELIDKGYTVVVLSTISIINRIYESYGNFNDFGEMEILKRINQATLLVLDDLGAEHESKNEKEKQIIYSILDERSRNRKPTICTTNLSLQQLKDKLTASDGVSRTYDRLIDLCTPVKVNGVSKRIQGAKDRQKQLIGMLTEEVK